MIGYIYLNTDLKNGKQYVGQHHYDKPELDPNYHGSGIIISKIYKKRPETIKEEYVKTCYSQEELDKWEKYFIYLYNTIFPNGYNLTEGGNGGILCEESRKKISYTLKGRFVKEKNPNYNRHLSDEEKEHLRKINIGKKLSEEHKNKIGKTLKGKSNKKLQKTVLQYTKDGIFIREWSSLMDCEKNGYNAGCISNCCHCKNRLLSHKGFIWIYKGDEHSIQNRIKKIKKYHVFQYTKDGIFIREWLSATECGRNGFDKSAVCSCCNGKQKTHKGYIWKYKQN